MGWVAPAGWPDSADGAEGGCAQARAGALRPDRQLPAATRRCRRPRSSGRHRRPACPAGRSRGRNRLLGVAGRRVARAGHTRRRPGPAPARRCSRPGQTGNRERRAGRDGAHGVSLLCHAWTQAPLTAKVHPGLVGPAAARGCAGRDGSSASSNFSFGLCTWSSARPKPISSESMPSSRRMLSTTGIEPPRAHQHGGAAVFVGQRGARRRAPSGLSVGISMPGALPNSVEADPGVGRGAVRPRSA